MKKEELNSALESALMCSPRVLARARFPAVKLRFADRLLFVEPYHERAD